MKQKKLDVKIIPILEDNYVFTLVDLKNKEAFVVDPGEVTAVNSFLKEEGLTLKGILITHHHHDHVDGVEELKTSFGCPVFAPLKNKKQIPYASHYVQDKDKISEGSFCFEVIEMPGHTLGHIAFWNEDHNWLFSGDVLFGLGCGKLFEGTPEQMFHSLQRIKALPQGSLVFCTHEYTETNLSFCKKLTAIDEAPIVGDTEELELYENELLNKRSLNLPSIPLKLDIEKRVNPFLLARDSQQLAYLRELRNRH